MKIKEQVDSIVAQMGEPQPLPLGRSEFEAWSDRIISGALVPGPDGLPYDIEVLQGADPDSDVGAFYRSLKAALCGLILHVGPTESHKPDAFFIHALRVSASKQVAVMMGEELKAKAKAVHEKKEKARLEALKFRDDDDDLCES